MRPEICWKCLLMQGLILIISNLAYRPLQNYPATCGGTRKTVLRKAEVIFSLPGLLHNFRNTLREGTKGRLIKK